MWNLWQILSYNPCETVYHKEVHAVKRFALGFICGALIFGGTAVLAESVSLVGKTVDGEVPVYYNDEPLVAKAITVEGTSYLPVRTVGNTLGANIEYRDGAVYVEQEDQYEAIKEKVMSDIKLEMQKDELRKEIEKLQAANANIRERIADLEKEIEHGLSAGSLVDGSVKAKEIVEKTLQTNLQKIADLEAQLAALEQQQSDPESEE